MQQTDILIIGGSLVGLSAAVFLGWRGVSATVIEKHTGSSPHPRAMGYTEHTLEFFRATGLDEKVPQVAPGTRLRRTRAISLAGEWIGETPWTPGESPENDGTSAASPCTGAAVAQDVLEPLLRERARELGTDLRLGVEMLSFEQYGDSVTVHVRERATGAEYGMRARYLIAADGADSFVRERLGIARQGVGYLRTMRSVLFRCREADAYLDRGIHQFVIEQPGLQAFLTTYGDGRWVLMFHDDDERDELALKAAVAQALGKPMTFDILATGRWEMAGRIAERYAVGRIFLAGDAAHQLPPTRGGFGANTGIDDVYNLAWKLELVLRHGAGDALLDTYNDERQPIGWLRHQQTFARPDYARWVGGSVDDKLLYSAAAMELGQLSRSSAVIGAGMDLPPAAEPETWAGQPGVRAPHVWVKRDGKLISTIDMFTRNFVLMTPDPTWVTAAREVAQDIHIPLECIQVGMDAEFPADMPFEHAFGVTHEGCSLVRPDGVVAWRSEGREDKPARRLRAVMAKVAALPD
ncbi:MULTISPECIES: FAD-dependent monooxygenase [Rhodanobacter]|jgi:2-polyprenyl-6-methoxyphenol hydroxylase-like FAD-dependent oxidoreductase|uniref:2-polyprenyl-6-methoxyphenol hydroxylase n=1 Tax=Rhodanobacter glycinis TaxID=582702 RepID=A0A1I4DCG1_9GAMM|nr:MULTISPECIES: FAD-dependent monooxygenase [Rhodanobacter]EIL95802.1 monooxygenase FAD-binding protein [Rhodanobacter sp. 115]SFK89806.1 2-polyprenyl-6-methoxyphenol hydroxylase [Rhodanobacter glycinis]